MIDTLKKTAPDRKCFRMVGGVLVERTVKDVLPALEYNHKQVDIELYRVGECNMGSGWFNHTKPSPTGGSMDYRRSGNFCCKNIFVVCTNHENKNTKYIL